MANLPEKNITTVDVITSIPSNTNVYVNVNGQFGQASIDDVVKASNVVSDATLSAMKEFIYSQFKTLTGSPILAQGSADGYVVSFTGAGGSEQKSYSGKNLLENDAISQTVGGLTFTVNDDKSIKVSGATTGANNLQIKTLALAAGTYVLSGMENVSGSGDMVMRVYDVTNSKIIANLNKGLTQITFTLSSETTLSIYINFNTVGITYSGTIYPMISVEGGNYEPFVGAQPSPNPSYPQQIKSKGDMGWFDGELVNGYYSDWHTVVASSNYISNKNKIACKENDDILLVYEESVGSLGIFFYDENNAFISSIKSTLANELRGVAPANAVYFTFYVNNTNVTTNAKKIVVTINGTYAVKVKSVGKNLLPSFRSRSASGLTFTSDNIGAVKIVGTSTSTASPGEIVKLKAGNYILSGASDIANITTSINYLRAIVNGKYYMDKGEGVAFSLEEETEVTVQIVVGNGVTINTTYYPMIRRAEITDSTFEEYKEHTEWIPLSEPLRGIGEVTDEIKSTDGVYRGHRKFKEAVFDGSNDEGWVLQSINEYGIANFYPSSSIIKGMVDKSAISNKFIKQTTSIADTTSEGIFNNVHNIYIRISQERANTAKDFTAWLAENPFTVLYEMAEEAIEELDQSPFYRLKTFEGVTHISATDDMEMVVEVPTSRAGGVASIGWSKGNLAQIETQNLSAKIAELQTAIVNM